MFESEHKIYKELEKYRVNKGKEFFNLPLDKAKKLSKNTAQFIMIAQKNQKMSQFWDSIKVLKSIKYWLDCGQYASNQM